MISLLLNFGLKYPNVITSDMQLMHRTNNLFRLKQNKSKNFNLNYLGLNYF